MDLESLRERLRLEMKVKGDHESDIYLPIDQWISVVDEGIRKVAPLHGVPDDLSQVTIAGPARNANIYLFLPWTTRPTHDEILAEVARFDTSRLTNSSGGDEPTHVVAIGGYFFDFDPRKVRETNRSHSSGEPPCLCSSRSLVTIGHEHGCAYMKWKQKGVQ